MSAVSWDRRCLLLTNHAMVLAVITSDPGVRIREIAQKVEITERAVESLIGDLIQVGFLSRRRSGRRNVYEVHGDANLRHPLIADTTVGGLLNVITPDEPEIKPEDAFGDAGITEETLACIEASVAPIVRTETTSTKEGTAVKKVLVYMIVTSVLLGASVAVAATTRQHHARPTPPTHHAPQSAPNATPAVTHSGASIPKITVGTVESHASKPKPHAHKRTHTPPRHRRPRRRRSPHRAARVQPRHRPGAPPPPARRR
jgi:hypothetical protein